ncbi:ankyrin repeat domain containing protein [Pandoravirus celtis]|nr:ankyrin repeat domain containing protein [Pandoravirus celtis]
MDQDHMDQDDVDPRRMACLGDLPPELLEMISGFLVSLRDLGAWAIATGLPIPAKWLCAAAQAHGYHERLVKAGAPLAVVMYFLHCGTLCPCASFVPVAACGGRVDVMEHVWSISVTAKSERDMCVNRLSHMYGYVSKSSCMSEAVRAVINTDRRDILCWLLAKGCRDTRSWMCTSGTVEKAIKFGLKKAYADVVCGGHALGRAHDKRICAGTCAWYMEKAIVKDRPRILAMLAAANCRAIDTLSNRHLSQAIAKGSLGVAQWLAGAIKGPVIVDNNSMQKAAARGHVGTLAFAHDRGLCDCPLNALLDAAAKGRLDVLVWAAGEGAQPPARPLAPWYGTHLAYAAAAKGRRNILEWMAARPDAHRTLGVGVARKALASDMWTCAFILHDRGLAPFGTWDALTTAVQYSDTDIVRGVARRGGRCDTATWTAALCRSRNDIVSFLCERFGTVGLQEAIDAVAGLDFEREPVAWLAANVPAVCVAQLVQQQRATKVCGIRPLVGECSCAACSSPATAV